jgi:hypothetical protein
MNDLIKDITPIVEKCLEDKGDSPMTILCAAKTADSLEVEDRRLFLNRTLDRLDAETEARLIKSRALYHAALLASALLVIGAMASFFYLMARP